MPGRGKAEKGENVTTYGKEDQFSAAGFLTRLDNWLGDFERLMSEVNAAEKRAAAELKKAEAELEKTFDQAKELEEVREQHRKIQADLLKQGGAIAMTPKMKAEWRAARKKMGVTDEPEEGTALSRQFQRGMFHPEDTAALRVVSGGMPLKDLHAVANIFRERLKGLPPLHVLETVAKAPTALKRDIRALGGLHDSSGAWHNGEIYLFAENLDSAEHAAWVILHEGTHHGLRGMLGRDLDPLLMRIYISNPTVRKLAAQQLAINPRLSDVSATEEALANMGADDIPQTVWEQIIAFVRRVIRRLGFNLRITDGDVRDLVTQALRFVKEKQRKTHVLSGTAMHSAWHGSAADFDQFSLHEIGSGEGAQVYGWGLYFADKKEVAEYYRDQVTDPQPTIVFEGRHISPTTFSGEGSQAERFTAGRLMNQVLLGQHKTEREDFDAALRKIIATADRNAKDFGAPESIQLERDIAAIARSWIGKAVDDRKRGRLYRVELAPKEGDYLNWDKPLSEQSQKVRDAIKKAGALDMFMRMPGGRSADPLGESIYRNLMGLEQADYLLSKEMGVPGYSEGGDYRGAFGSSEEAASRFLASIGIPGIRYLDQGTRNLSRMVRRSFSGEGKWSVVPTDAGPVRYFEDKAEAERFADRYRSYNYVIFDDRLVKIEAKLSRRAGRPAGPTSPLSWQEFGRYLESAPLKDAFGKLSASEKRTIAAAGNSWRLAAVNPDSLEEVAATPDAKSPIIIGVDGDVIDGRNRRQQAIARGEKAISAWIASDEELNPPSASRTPQTETAAFRKWFGDSKVVDDQGKPLVVYHGGASPDEFQTPLFVSRHRNVASSYASEFNYSKGGAVTPLYASIQNPANDSDVREAVRAVGITVGHMSGLPLEDMPAWEALTRGMMREGETDKVVAELKRRGFDGAWIEGDFAADDNMTEYDSIIVFDSHQVKSAIGNRGTFEPGSRSTMLSRGAAQPRGRGTLGHPVVRSGYRTWAKKTIDTMDAWLEPIGKLPEKKKYLVERYKALGRIAKADELAGYIRKAFTGASAEDKKAVYDYLVTAGAASTTIKDEVTRANAEMVKKQIAAVGRGLVEHGLLSEEAHEQYRDGYLPRLYLKHLLSEGDFQRLGAGKKPSDMGYLKARKDIPEEVRRVILGEITDPGFLGAVAVAKPLRDMVLLDWLAQMSQQKDWVLKGVLVEWGEVNLLKPAATPDMFGGGVKKRLVSAYWLKDEAARIRRQAEHYDAPTAARAHALALKMERAAAAALGDLKVDHKQFKQIPDTARYGRLRGIWVRREIYDDLMGVNDFLPTEPGFFQNLLGYGGVGTKITQLWKTGKVALNPPSQIRNFVSNGVLLQLSGVPLPMVPARVAQAWREIVNDGKHWKVAKKYGVTESTFTAQELYRAKRELLDLENDMGQLSPMGKLHRLGARIMDFGGDTYQRMEALFKTAKIIDAMASGMSEEDAALEAQKWLFDYSLVAKEVRYLRNAPIGVPFLTFQIKVLPRMAEVALLHPWRFLPWAALLYGMSYALAAAYDVDDDDLEKLKQALPDWLRERGHTMLLPYKDAQGRWQVLDLGYYFPWTNWTELVRNIKSGEVGKAIQTAGIFSGPITDLIVAVKTGRDPFTDRDIWKAGDPPARQALALMNYLWTMAAPPFLTSMGFVGHATRAYTGETNRYGDPLSTPTQAALRLFGVNVYALEPEQSRAANIRKQQFEIDEVRQAAKQRLVDRTLSPERREAISAEYQAEAQRRQEKLVKYIGESGVHPNLQTAR